MTRRKMKRQKEFWVLNDNRDVIYRTTTKLGAAAFILGRGSGSVVKVTGCVLPDLQIRSRDELKLRRV